MLQPNSTTDPTVLGWTTEMQYLPLKTLNRTGQLFNTTKAAEIRSEWMMRNLLFGVTGMILNILSLILLGVSKQIKMALKITLLNQALNDFVFMVISTVLGTIASDWTSDHWGCWPLAISLCTSVVVGYENVCFLAVHNFIAVFYPLNCNLIMTPIRSAVGVVAVWLLGGFIITASAEIHPIFGRPCYPSGIVSRFSIASMSISCIICTICVTFLNIKIFAKIKKRQREVHAVKISSGNCRTVTDLTRPSLDNINRINFPPGTSDPSGMSIILNTHTRLDPARDAGMSPNSHPNRNTRVTDIDGFTKASPGADSRQTLRNRNLLQVVNISQHSPMRKAISERCISRNDASDIASTSAVEDAGKTTRFTKSSDYLDKQSPLLSEKHKSHSQSPKHGSEAASKDRLNIPKRSRMVLTHHSSSLLAIYSRSLSRDGPDSPGDTDPASSLSQTVEWNFQASSKTVSDVAVESHDTHDQSEDRETLVAAENGTRTDNGNLAGCKSLDPTTSNDDLKAEDGTQTKTENVSQNVDDTPNLISAQDSMGQVAQVRADDEVGQGETNTKEMNVHLTQTEKAHNSSQHVDVQHRYQPHNLWTTGHVIEEDIETLPKNDNDVDGDENERGDDNNTKQQCHRQPRHRISHYMTTHQILDIQQQARQSQGAQVSESSQSSGQANRTRGDRVSETTGRPRWPQVRLRNTLVILTLWCCFLTLPFIGYFLYAALSENLHNFAASKVGVVFSTLVMANSITNPFLYAWRFVSWRQLYNKVRMGLRRFWDRM